LETIKNYVLAYNNMAVEQSFYLMIYNSLREYFFDRNGYIFGHSAADHIKSSIDDIYKFKRDRENVLLLLLLLLLLFFFFQNVIFSL
jgi:hypothetical protein